MITLDFYLAVSLFLMVILGISLLTWITARGQKDRELSLNKKFIWFCTVCTYTYINTKEEAFTSCPRCGSINKR